MATLFQASFLLTGPFWLLMIVAPHWQWTKRIIQSPLVILPAALLYSVLILPMLTTTFPSLLNPSLANVAALLGSDSGATVGWVHYLAFDLFVGRWAYLESRKYHMNVWIMASVLFFILILGPFGFVLYLVVRTVYGRLANGNVVMD